MLAAFNVHKSSTYFVAHLAYIPVRVKCLPHSRFAKIKARAKTSEGVGGRERRECFVEYKYDDSLQVRLIERIEYHR